MNDPDAAGVAAPAASDLPEPRAIARVAVLGLGTMGLGMAKNLAGAGFTVVGWNRGEARRAAAAAAGLEVAPTIAAAVSGADAAVVVLADDAAVRAVVLGAGPREPGVLAGLSSGALLLDCGTTSLALTGEIATAAAERGIRFVAAPVTGSRNGANAGTLTFMVGGAAPSVAHAQPLFAAMGKHVVHVGEPPSAGQAAKYCLNLSQAVVLQGVLEGYALAKTLGVPLAALAEIFEHSAGKTGVGTFKTPYLLRGELDEPHFRLDLMAKDLHLGLGEAQARRVPLPAAQTVRLLYDQAVAEGLGPRDFLATARLLERWLGAPLRDDAPATAAGDPAEGGASGGASA